MMKHHVSRRDLAQPSDVCVTHDSSDDTGGGVSLGSQLSRKTWTSVCNLNQLDAAGFDV